MRFDPTSHALSRRRFLEFLGVSGATLMLPVFSACTTPKSLLKTNAKPTGLPFSPLAAMRSDTLTLAEGFQHSLLMKWGDAINPTESWGTNNDYLAYVPLAKDDGLLWSNHEYLFELFVSGYERSKGIAKTREQMETERRSLGGSIIRIRRNEKGIWKLVPNDPYNRRVDGRYRIPLISDRPIEGSKVAIGTFANCAGGTTPWGTILTCEENYQDYYGEVRFTSEGKREYVPSSSYALGLEKFEKLPPEHYGWVVEVDLRTGKAKKLVAMGRFAHEGANIRLAADGRPVAYMGDDANDECIYKFIGSKKGSLEKGDLYVANLTDGRWEHLHFEKNPKLKGKFRDQTELLIRCREAAHWAGGTSLDRPEDIEIHPSQGWVLASLTNNKEKKNYFGSLLKLNEKNNDPLSLEFTHSTFMAGGPDSGFACPDNLCFDARGNIWMTSDMSGSSIGKAPYTDFGNNSLFYIPLEGPAAGGVYRVASAPHDAEFTGPFFSPDRKTLFLSVQHPGEQSKSLTELTSHWPDGENSIPRSAVVAIEGPALDRLLQA